jgi:CBS domain-containing protein
MKTGNKIKDILKEKPKDIFFISPEKTVYEALEIMAEKDIGALLVLDENKKVVGIFSERDYARKCILAGRHSKDTKVSELMTTKVYFVTPEEKVEDVMVLMTEKKIRHLPVMEGEKLVGIVSIGDIVKSIIEEQNFLIQNLERYIISS